MWHKELEDEKLHRQQQVNYLPVIRLGKLVVLKRTAKIYHQSAKFTFGAIVFVH